MPTEVDEENSSNHMATENVASTAVFQNLRNFISVVDQLRDVGLQKYITLPRICVLGTQSAGKSSVLESIVGVDFLPRGEGIVTRRPLELRLVHIPPEQDPRRNNGGGGVVSRGDAAGLPSLYAVFEDSPENRMRDFVEVRRKIERLTDEVAGKNKGIVDEPIVLTIYGNDVPDLTLIDLPGITRVPLRGSDQTDDIERLTRDMALRYASDPRTIILAVIPANQDIGTSDALQLSRKVDPQGLRTVGVITKVDLMDKGTNALKMLRGEDVNLRLGYVAVKNRSQEDIVTKKSIRDAVDDEQRFFKNHPLYRSLSDNLYGIIALNHKLTHILFKHIRRYLPEIEAEVRDREINCRLELEDLGEGVPDTPAEQEKILWQLINDYCDTIRNLIRGKYDRRLNKQRPATTDPSLQENRVGPTGAADSTGSQTPGGAEIRYIFYELLSEYAGVSVTAELTNQQIELALHMHEGDSLPGFPSQDTFEHLILPFLRRIRLPVMECLEKVAQLMLRMSQCVADIVFERFCQLRDDVLAHTQTIILGEKEATQHLLEKIVAAEIGYLFTNDAEYLAEHSGIVSWVPISREDSQQLGNEQNPGNAPNDGIYGFNEQHLPPHIQQQNHQDQTLFGSLRTQWRGVRGAIAPNLKESGGNGISSGGFVQSVVGNVSGIVNNVGGYLAVSQPDSSKQPLYSENFLFEIRRRLDSYFNLALKHIRDVVPKIIGLFLVRAVQEKLQYDLYSRSADSGMREALLNEPEHIKHKRQALKLQLKTLHDAASVLQRDPSILSLLSSSSSILTEEDLCPPKLPARAQIHYYGGGGGATTTTVGGPMYTQRFPPRFPVTTNSQALPQHLNRQQHQLHPDNENPLPAADATTGTLPKSHEQAGTEINANQQQNNGGAKIISSLGKSGSGGTQGNKGLTSIF